MWCPVPSRETIPFRDGRVMTVEAALLDISSTEIRQRIKTGKGIRRMVPKAVADLILKEKLYV